VKFLTDGFDPFGGCPPRGSVGISAAHAVTAINTARLVIMYCFAFILFLPIFDFRFRVSAYSSLPKPSLKKGPSFSTGSSSSPLKICQMRFGYL
jgi:hypothetical protein